MSKNANGAVTIYKLIDPRDNSVKYIGRTHKPLKKRLDGHLADARRGSKSHRCKWIRKLLSKGLIPSIEALENVAWDKGSEREQYWIAWYGRKNLVNGTDGGEGTLGLSVSKETRAKQSLSHAGKPTWNKGISTSTEHLKDFQFKKGNIPFNKGIPQPAEVKNKLSKSRIGKSTGRRKTTKGLCFGVTYFREDAIWISQIRFMNKSYFIGRYKTEKEAGIAYDICSLWFSTKDRKLNFPNKREEYMTLLNNKIENLKKLRKIINNYLENGGKII
jgi:hypothetical protein